jgi:hypothetical protein
MKIAKPKVADILNFALILGLAVLIWFFVQQEIVETSEIEFKVQFQLPENQKLVVMSYSVGRAQNPEKVTLKLRGSKAKLTELLVGEIKELRVPVVVDETAVPPDAPLKQKIVITDEMLHLPSNVTLAEKVTVDVFVDALTTQECRVKLNYEGASGELPSLPKVTVTGPRSVVNSDLEILTERVDSSTFQYLKERELMLLNRVAEYRKGVRPDLTMRVEPPTVKVTPQEPRVEVTMENVPIKLLGPPEFLKRWTVEIQGGWTRTLRFMVPKGKEETAKASKPELVLDVSSFNLDKPEIPTSPQALGLHNQPDWMKLGEDEDTKRNTEVTIIKFKSTNE